MTWVFYSLAFLLALALTAMAVYGLYWASRHGQLRNFESGAASIFDAAEPVGQATDRFPPRRVRRPPVAPAERPGA